MFILNLPVLLGLDLVACSASLARLFMCTVYSNLTYGLEMLKKKNSKTAYAVHSVTWYADEYSCSLAVSAAGLCL
jgi:hypothetical protein